jgi:cytochrome P450
MSESRNPALECWGDYDRDDPFPLFAEVLAAGEVHDATLVDGHRAFLIVGHDAARAALNHPDLSKDMHAALARAGAVVSEGLPGPAFARHMLSVDQPDHTRLRGLAAPAFTSARLSALRERIEHTIEALLDALEYGEGPVDLVAGFAAPLPFIVIGELLGIPRPDQERLAEWFAVLLMPYPGDEPPAETVAASESIVAYLHEFVDRRWEEPTPDLVGDLVRAAQDSELTRQELDSTLFQLIVAGHHTTTSLIGNGVAALLEHPEQWESLVADPALVPQAVEEIMRWDAPVPHSTFRYAVRDVTIGDVVIPEGVQVLVSLAAAGRDPSHTADAERFDVTRERPTHLAFGHGIHHCLGARLARLEAQLAFSALVRRFPQMRLAVDPADLHWDHGDGLVLRGLNELPVYLT